MLCKGSRGGRRRGEKEGRGNGERAKEVTRAAGGKAAGAWMMQVGGWGGRGHAMIWTII
jgi:hypothetical protein